ncbi:MAG: PqqD family protein [Promethearchaeota archaeon]
MVKKKKKESAINVTPQDLLKIVPIKNPLVEVKKYDSGEIALFLKPVETKRRGFVSKLFPMPKGRRIVLDEMGTHFWNCCNSKNRVKDIIKVFQESYKMNELEARISISLFLENLTKRRLVGFILPHSLRKKYEKQDKQFLQLIVSDLPESARK